MRSRRFVMVEPSLSMNSNENKYVYFVIDPVSQSVQSFGSPDAAWEHIFALEAQEKIQESEDETTSPGPGT